MVLGLSSKSRRGSAIQVDYLIHIHDIKPWPPSQSLRSLRSVVIQWENGDRNSGTTNPVAPSLGSVIGEGKIEFNESFKLPLTLLKDASARNKGVDVFFKNLLELNLYEPRREKTHQLLATATIDLADYGLLKESLSVTAPMNSKRSYRNTTQPVLHLTIQPVDRLRASSSSINSFNDEAKNSGESVSALMNEEYYKEAEIASITDDDVSSHSSLTVSSSTLESNGGFSVRTEEEEHERVNKSSKVNSHERSQSASESRQGDIADQIPSRSSSVDLSSVFHLPKDIPDPEPNTSVYGLEDRANVFVTDTNESSKLVSTIPHNNREIKSMPFQVDDQAQNASPRDFENSRDMVSDQESETIVEKSRKVKSVRSSLDISRSTSRLSVSTERKEAKVVYPKSTSNTTLESKVKNLESKVKKLEGELREAAAIEAALYSVVAEHGSSSSKVHAPARRLLRLYLHACKENHLSRRSNAAKTAVSGLVLVAKACGNDVPRLTFWLSNTIVLRTIISDTRAEEELPVSAGPVPRKQKVERETDKQLSLKWKDPSLSKNDIENFGAWDDPITFIAALKRVEAWIFSRIVESIWWQTLTPHMQSSAALTREFDKSNGSVLKKSFGKLRSMNQEQGDFSLQLWKKAFRDAHERLCPLRASGHECGCLPVLARLIMEQCVARLDVAMFNAILRDSDDNFPTDPVSDPIADSRVLPIPSTTSSFGSGAQLKNSIGNWSRWLTDLFGIDDDDDDEDEGSSSNENHNVDRSFKTFHLLKALSDLMMIPKAMLLNSSVRKEVCPMFGAPLIKRVLNNFVPDEFCPDPVPDEVLEALKSEEEAEKAMMNSSYPWIAPPPEYSPPSGASISTIIGDFGQRQAPQLCRIRSSVTRKAYTSDDELDELSSPLAVVVLQQAGSKKVNNGDADETVRYQLLRECWMMNGE